MKLINKVLVTLICLSGLTSCGKGDDGLNKYRRNGQLVDLQYEIFDEKIIDDDSFVFFLKREGCHSCSTFYPIVGEFLEENKDAKIYVLNYNELQPIEAVTIASYFVEALGNSYYGKNDYMTTTLYSPSICKVVKGEVVEAEIGVIDKTEISYYYQDNYSSLDSYYEYNRKVQKEKNFNVFISLNEDKGYDDELRNYFLTNQDVKGYYLDASDFSESEYERLLNRINYYLGEGNEVEEVPEYCLLQYENGAISNYIDVKYDVGSLNVLYNK